MATAWKKKNKKYRTSALISTFIISLSLQATEPQSIQATEMEIEVCKANEDAQQPQTKLKDQLIQTKKTQTETTQINLRHLMQELKNSCIALALFNTKAQEDLDKDFAEIARLKNQEKLSEWEKIRERKRKEFERLIHPQKPKRKSYRHAKVS